MFFWRFCRFTGTLRVWTGKEGYPFHALACIGSKVAPVLSNSFLGGIDKCIQRNVSSLLTNVFRYLDDFLVFVQPCDKDKTVRDIVQVFIYCGLGLEFTHEAPQDNKLRFLDIKLDVKPDHVCWMHSPRSEKPLLNFNSLHSKVIKNGIAVPCLRSALLKCYVEAIGTSFSKELQSLKDAGSPSDVICLTVKKLIKMGKDGHIRNA